MTAGTSQTKTKEEKQEKREKREKREKGEKRDKKDKQRRSTSSGHSRTSNTSSPSSLTRAGATVAKQLPQHTGGMLLSLAALRNWGNTSTMCGRHTYQHRAGYTDDGDEDAMAGGASPATGFSAYKAGTLPLPFNYFSLAPLSPPGIEQKSRSHLREPPVLYKVVLYCCLFLLLFVICICFWFVATRASAVPWGRQTDAGRSAHRGTGT